MVLSFIYSTFFLFHEIYKMVQVTILIKGYVAQRLPCFAVFLFFFLVRNTRFLWTPHYSTGLYSVCADFSPAQEGTTQRAEKETVLSQRAVQSQEQRPLRLYNGHYAKAIFLLFYSYTRYTCVSYRCFPLQLASIVKASVLYRVFRIVIFLPRPLERAENTIGICRLVVVYPTGFNSVSESFFGVRKLTVVNSVWARPLIYTHQNNITPLCA